MVNVLCIITHNLHPSILDLFKILIKDPYKGLQLWTSRVFTLTLWYEWIFVSVYKDHYTNLSAHVPVHGEMPLFPVCVFVRDPASGHRGCVYCGAAILQQPGGHRQPQGPEETQGLSFQEGNWNLQLLLLQHHPGCQAQQTGKEITVYFFFFLLGMETVLDVIGRYTDVVDVLLFRDW